MTRLQQDKVAALEVEEFKKRVVWGRAHIVPSHDPARYRMDDHGCWIRYADYGNCLSDHGWVFGPEPGPGPEAAGPLGGRPDGRPCPEDITRLWPVNWRNLLVPQERRKGAIQL
ncbi:MAG: hypothetical protein OEM59_11330 [Rhodospirillales bacterium]|nr:hypothetical protein [Rhodospirillales bacterium]